MHIALFLLFGLSVGALARLVFPGNAPGGFVASMVIGVLGAFIGGFLGRVVGAYPSYQSPGGIVASILGAVGLVAIWQPLVLRSAAQR